MVCAVLSGKSFAPVNCPESSSQICRSWFLTKMLKMAAISFVRGGEGEGLQYSSWRESIFQQRDNFKVFSLKSFLYSQKKEMVCITAVGENLYFNSRAFFLDLSRCHELFWKSTDIKHFNHFADLSCDFLLTFIQCYC